MGDRGRDYANSADIQIFGWPHRDYGIYILVPVVEMSLASHIERPDKAVLSVPIARGRKQEEQSSGARFQLASGQTIGLGDFHARIGRFHPVKG
jgi:hypothetical protein